MGWDMYFCDDDYEYEDCDDDNVESDGDAEYLCEDIDDRQVVMGFNGAGAVRIEVL